MALTGDTLDFVQGGVVTSSAQIVDGGATVGDVLTVQADKSIAAAPGGGSQPVIGRPKQDDDTTFYGVPFSSATSSGWGGFSPQIGTLVYAFLLIPEAITVTELAWIPNSAGAEDMNARALLIPCDTDWQPSDDPVVQLAALLPFEGVVGDEPYEIPPFSPIAVPAGRYLAGAEFDQGDWSMLGQFANQDVGSYCAKTGPGQMISLMLAAHAYGTITDAPRWTSVVPAIDTDEGNGPLIPFVFGWDPA